MSPLTLSNSGQNGFCKSQFLRYLEFNSEVCIVCNLFCIHTSQVKPKSLCRLAAGLDSWMSMYLPTFQPTSWDHFSLRGTYCRSKCEKRSRGRPIPRSHGTRRPGGPVYKLVVVCCCAWRWHQKDWHEMLELNVNLVKIQQNWSVGSS